VAALRSLTQAGVAWRGAAHITGGGLIDNPPRFVPESSGLALRFRLGSWPVPAIFTLIAGAGVAEGEMRRTFNMGLGLVLAVPPGEIDRAIAALEAAGERAWRVGEVIRRAGDEVELG
jgi:phosphoribosylformylglycinamidine cyclo-ligase